MQNINQQPQNIQDNMNLRNQNNNQIPNNFNINNNIDNNNNNNSQNIHKGKLSENNFSVKNKGNIPNNAPNQNLNEQQNPINIINNEVNNAQQNLAGNINNNDNNKNNVVDINKVIEENPVFPSTLINDTKINENPNEENPVFPSTLVNETKISEKPKDNPFSIFNSNSNNTINSGSSQNEIKNDINIKDNNEIKPADISGIKTIAEPTIVNSVVQPEPKVNNNEEQNKIQNERDLSSVSNPFYTQNNNPFDNTLGESNILSQNKNQNNLESNENNQEQNVAFENIKDPIASLIETNTIIAEKKEENAINLEPFGGNTNIDTLIKSEANQNNNEQINNEIKDSIQSNNPLYYESHVQNDLNQNKGDINIPQNNNNENNINVNNVEQQIKNMNLDNSSLPITTESKIINENNNEIQNQSNNNMINDDEEEKIEFASKIQPFNQNENQPNIKVPSLTQIIANEINKNDNNDNNGNI